MPYPIEIAYFTPKTKTGSALWIDFYNADLFDPESLLEECNDNDQIRFMAMRWRIFMSEWREKIPDLNIAIGKGIVQAGFEADADGYYIVVAKLSSYMSWVDAYINKEYQGYHYVNTSPKTIVVATPILKKGEKYIISLVQKPVGWWNSPLWFHSITVFRFV